MVEGKDSEWDGKLVTVSLRSSPRFSATTPGLAFFVLFAIAGSATDSPSADDAFAERPSHGLALYGETKYGPDFPHFDYVNPDAPKGGELKLGMIGSFDSLNPFILKGTPARHLSLMYDRLLEYSNDEPFSGYGSVAESITVPADNSWVVFTLRPEARWHDGVPITPEDVLFSLDILKAEGHPHYRSYYAAITRAEKVGDRQVKFTFGPETNREMPLIVGQFHVLPKHYWESRPFAVTTMEQPLGSGPYRLAAVEAGRHVTFERVPDYWGIDLPVKKGRCNFDRIHFDYYRDETVAIEAVKAGQIDIRQETGAKTWANSYDIPAVAEGRLLMEEIPHQRAAGMKAFWFNTRRPLLADPIVRRALAYAFDFEWTNKRLFYGRFSRTRSYFENSELASTGLPAGRELEILTPYRGRVPDEVFTTLYEPPSTDGSGRIRENLQRAKRLLRTAGWIVDEGVLRHATTGKDLRLEFLLDNPASEQYVQPLVGNLKRLGILATVRTVDRPQYQNRIQNFDFDVIVHTQRQSHNPGNEQTDFWHSRVADQPASGNWAGIKDQVVDELVEKVITAPDRRELVATTRALDRVLLWGHYVIPHWYASSFSLIWWDKFGRPETVPPFPGGRFFISTWWFDEEKAANLSRTE